jgi:hypothetical protein
MNTMYRILVRRRPLAAVAAVATAACLALGAGPVLAHAEHGKPMHGGLVAEAGIFQGELVHDAKGLVIILTDHGQPVAAAGASGRLTVLAGAKKSEFALVPAGTNRLIATGATPLERGAKAVASVKLGDGRSGALRFESK